MTIRLLLCCQRPVRNNLRVSHVSIHADSVILTGTGHDILVDVHPEADPFMSRYLLENLLALDVPEHDLAALTRGGNKRYSVENTEAATNGKLFVLVALIRLLDAACDIVPESDAVVEVESEHESSIGGEADAGHGWVVLVNECSEALPGGSVPDSTGGRRYQYSHMGSLGRLLPSGEHLHQAVSGTANHQGPVATKVNATDRVAVSGQAPHQSPSSDIPQKNGLIVGTAGQDVALWRKR